MAQSRSYVAVMSENYMLTVTLYLSQYPETFKLKKSHLATALLN